MLPILWHLPLLLLLPLPVLLLSEGDGRALPYPPGDPRLCLERQPDLQRFEVLPGLGWDNLQNTEEATVVSYNYSLCLTTDDGRFLVPDAVSTVPIKTSSLQTFAELITHWDNFSSSTATSVNVEAGVSFLFFSISGKFSSEFSNAKEHMIGDKSATTRVQVRYVRYKARLQPDQPLSPAFRSRVVEIASLLQQQQSQHAAFLAQLLVRDFGSHVITAVDAGAVLSQTDQVNSEYVKNKAGSKTSITAAASASFLGIFHMSFSVTHSTDQEAVKEYTHSRTRSSVECQGGSAFSANTTLQAWTRDVDKDLVAVDRRGDPLWFLITPQSLPELPRTLVAEVSKTVRQAVETYYAFNTYRGCTNPDAPNFSAAANVEDGTCHTSVSNLTLGGVFLSCTMTRSERGDLCGNHTQVNPKTGAYSCPSGYQQAELHSVEVESPKDCRWWWAFGRCYYSAATVRSYWCAPQGKVTQESGFLFGGLYTDHVVNLLTHDRSCPGLFHPFKFGTSLVVCLSDDYELASRAAVPLGGFFSCQAGNPLALESPTPLPRLVHSPYHSLHSFLQQTGPSSWPKRCPKGYSQHLADMENGCAIHYCLKSGALSPRGLPPLRRPPFFAPALPPLALRAEEMGKVQGVQAKSQAGQGQMSAGVIAAICAGTIAACVALVIAVVVLRRRCRRCRRLHDDTHPIIPCTGNSYDAIEEEELAVSSH